MTNTNKDFSSQSFVRLHQQTFIKKPVDIINSWYTQLMR